MPTEKIFNTWYRSMDKNGELWAESSDFDEIEQSLKDIPGGSMYKCEQVLVTRDWTKMSKKERKKKRHGISV